MQSLKAAVMLVTQQTVTCQVTTSSLPGIAIYTGIGEKSAGSVYDFTLGLHLYCYSDLAYRSVVWGLFMHT